MTVSMIPNGSWLLPPASASCGPDPLSPQDLWQVADVALRTALRTAMRSVGGTAPHAAGQRIDVNAGSPRRVESTDNAPEIDVLATSQVTWRGAGMLTEDPVIRALRQHLTTGGWQIVSWAEPDRRGPDIVAMRNGTRLEVEAKGAGRSKPHTARYGQPFNAAQVRVHVGEAVLKALRVVAAGTAGAAVAFPETPRHRAETGPVEPVLNRLGITVYWVTEDGSVTSSEPSAQLAGDNSPLWRGTTRHGR